MSISRVVVFINALAGSVDDDDTEGEIARIESAFAAGAPELDVVVEAVDPARLQERAKAIWAADPPDAIVVGGGDGTVNNAANAAAGTDIVLGVLPLGTFNHFAGDLGMPSDLTEAAAALASGVIRTVDVAEVNGRVFVNNSLLGVYPHMVASRDEIMDRRGWGKIRAVPAAVLHTLRSFPTHRFDLRGNGGFVRRRLRTPFVFVGNGVYQTPGGATPTREHLDRGVLGVEVARGESRLRLIAIAVVAVMRGGGRARDLDQHRLRELTVMSHTSRLQVAFDGEVEWLDTPLRYRIRPGDLHVLAPA